MPITIPIIANSGAKSTVSVADPPVGTVQVLVSIGETAILPEPDNGNGNLICAQPITLTEAGVLQSLSFYVTTVGGKLRLGLYSGATVPTAKVAEVAEFTPGVGWNSRPTLTTPTLAIGRYWLVYFPQSNSLGFRKAQTGGTSYIKTLTYGSLPATFPTSLNATPSHWSFMGTILVTRTPVITTPIDILIGGSTGPGVPITFPSAVDANSLVGPVTVATNTGVSYSGTITLGGADASKFTLSNGGVYPCNLLVGPVDIAAGTYHISLTAS